MVARAKQGGGKQLRMESARGTSSDTEISIGIFPADEAEAPRTEAAADAGVGTDDIHERSCLGHFSNPKIEAFYESERPGVNVENGHRQILVMHVVPTVVRAALLYGSGLINELDGRYEEEFLFSMLLATLACGFLIFVNVLFHLWRKTDFGNQVTMLYRLADPPVLSGPKSVLYLQAATFILMLEASTLLLYGHTLLFLSTQNSTQPWL